MKITHESHHVAIPVRQIKLTRAYQSQIAKHPWNWVLSPCDNRGHARSPSATIFNSQGPVSPQLRWRCYGDRWPCPREDVCNRLCTYRRSFPLFFLSSRVLMTTNVMKSPSFSSSSTFCNCDRRYCSWSLTACRPYTHQRRCTESVHPPTETSTPSVHTAQAHARHGDSLEAYNYVI